MFKVDLLSLGVFVDSSKTSLPTCLMLASFGWCTCLQLSPAVFIALRVSLLRSVHASWWNISTLSSMWPISSPCKTHASFAPTHSGGQADPRASVHNLPDCFPNTRFLWWESDPSQWCLLLSFSLHYMKWILAYQQLSQKKLFTNTQVPSLMWVRGLKPSN